MRKVHALNNTSVLCAQSTFTFYILVTSCNLWWRNAHDSWQLWANSHYLIRGRGKCSSLVSNITALFLEVQIQTLASWKLPSVLGTDSLILSHRSKLPPSPLFCFHVENILMLLSSIRFPNYFDEDWQILCHNFLFPIILQT